MQQIIGGHCHRRSSTESAGNGILPNIRFNQTQFHHSVALELQKDCKAHIQPVGTSYECGIYHVRMCPDTCFVRYHTLCDYLFDDPSRHGPMRLKYKNGTPRIGPGRPQQRRSR